ncbi:MAG: 50S ribosomal protein L25 [Candidatus Marinimicrobia bacterium]|nr:50S ribosomal protein L25 [Candidatus Neomarinimicrobiota bacterium]
MSSEYTLDLIERDSFGTSSTNKLRRQGLIPVNFYTHGGGNHNFAIEEKKMSEALKSDQHIFVIKIDKKEQHVQIKELQYHPVYDTIMHVDLMGFKMTEKISIAVPLVIVGEAPGVKEGGLLIQNINQIDISCLPTDVPDSIEVDISDLDINEHISVGDLEVAEGIEVLSNAEIPIVAVQTPRGEEEEEVSVDEDEIGEEEETDAEEEAGEE